MAHYFLSWLRRHQFAFSGNIQADQARLRKLDAGARARLELFLGHAPYRTGLADVDAAPTITMVRQPVARVESFCQHVSEGKSPVIHKSPRGPAMDLDAFLSEDRVQLHNFQSRILLGNGSYQLPSGTVEELAGRALQVLTEAVTAFGITEEFDRSLLLLWRMMGWKRKPVYRLRNTADPMRQLTFAPRHLERIRELNQIDHLLYEGAKTLFQQRLATFCPDIESLLGPYRNQLAQPQPVFMLMASIRYLRALLGSAA